MFHHFVFANNFLVTGSWDSQDGLFRNLGPVAVMIFFFITAFLFYGRAGDSKDIVDWVKTYISRFFRIAPLYAFAIIVMFLIVYTRDGWTLAVSVKQEATSFIKSLALGLFRFTPINGDDRAFVINAGVTWTLRYEWIFYFSLPLVALFIRFVPSWTVRIGVLLAAFLVGGLLHRQAFGFRTEPAVVFTLGMLAYEISKFKAIKPIMGGPITSAVGLVCLGIALVYPFSWFAPMQIALAFCFFLPTIFENSYFGVLHMAASRMLGEISYGLYLLHGMVLYLGLRAFAGAGLLPEGDARWWLILPLSTVVVLTSAATYVVIERPGIAVGRRLSRAISRQRMKVPATAA